MKKRIIEIEGMGCSGCVTTIENTISALPGVKTAVANLEEGIAEIEFDEKEVNEDHFRTAVKEAGYEMIGIKQ